MDILASIIIPLFDEEVTCLKNSVTLSIRLDYLRNNLVLF